MQKVLIDSDVILDFFLKREPFATDAARILSLCDSGKVTGFITPVICSNIYYILRRLASHDRVIEKIRMLLSMVEIVSIDKAIVVEAAESDFTDFEDALQSFSAYRSGMADAIITRNIRDYKHSPVAAISPDDFLKIYKA